MWEKMPGRAGHQALSRGFVHKPGLLHPDQGDPRQAARLFAPYFLGQWLLPGYVNKLIP